MNGYNNSQRPVAYFFNAATQDSRERSGDSFHQRVPNATAAIGLVPTPQLSLFGYATATQLKANYSGDNVTTLDTALDNLDRKVEGGFEYHFSPRSMIWAKVSKGTTTQDLSDKEYSDRDVTDAAEYQFRHTVRVGSRNEVSWGAEAASRERLISGTFPDEDPKNGKPIIGSFNVSTTTRSEFVYAADRFAWTKSWLLDGLMTLTRTTDKASDIPEDDRVKYYASPRVGVAYRFGEQRLVRASYEDWVRPASDSMLAPVATAGIPTDDRLADFNARTKGARVQVEWAWNPTTFTKGFVAHEGVDGAPPTTFPQAGRLPANAKDALERIKNNSLTNAATTNLFEGEPLAAHSTLNAAGVSINQVIGSEVSAYAQYEFTPSETTSDTLSIYFVPRHQVVLGATWVSPQRFYVSGQMVRRSERRTPDGVFDDVQEVYGDLLWPSDWEGRLKAYWELPSKRWSVEFEVKNLFVKDPIAFFKPTTSTIDLKFRY